MSGVRLSREDRVARAGRFGPARLLADLPQLGFALIALLLLVNLAVVGQRAGNSGRRSSAEDTAPVTVPTRGPVEVDIFGSSETGPLPGTKVADYLNTRKAELARRVAGEPGPQAAAVVSFSSARTPAAVEKLLAGRGVSGVLVRVQVRGKVTDAGLLPIEGALAPSLARGLSALAHALAADAAANVNQGNTTTNTQITVNAQQKQAFYDEAATENAELAVLRAAGPSIYGAVVSGSYADLGELAAKRGVRLVDPADDTVAAAMVVPHALAPDDAETVAKQQTLEGLKPA